MKILYGVVGEGMGHATRSRVVLEHLLSAGHEVKVVVSGRAHKFLTERLASRANLTLEEIHGLSLRYFGNRLDKSESLFENLKKAPKGIKKNVEVYRKVAEDGFTPELVISDFESWAAFYALNHFLPVISIDNMQVINRCRHDKAVAKSQGLNFRIAKLAVKMKMPGAYHYLVTSFFYPPVKKRRTTLVPPILRPEILAAKREPGDHVLVYQTAGSNEALVPTLKKLPYRFRVYGMGRDGSDGNVTLRPFSETGFVEDLRTARAVIAGGGFSLMSEAVTLHVPMLSVPIEQQYEQELNARYLAHLGYGQWAPELDRDVISSFLGRTDELSHNLERFERHDNAMLFACVDELIRRRAADEPGPDRLDAEAMGKWAPDEVVEPEPALAQSSEV
ncbi:MAG: teichoic acid biosynthesis protein [Polyangiaceae bacterium]|nr:teichoic acid biosynthesis protein [Polyangiaceae bacterium]MCE7893538.1 teichoic acid biosynthesis protein [Sorangiineae bacterium PRO1]MCL4755817.1 teichoic acid biosynthesis protein [Myxococcales bacterium]